MAGLSSDEIRGLLSAKLGVALNHNHHDIFMESKQQPMSSVHTAKLVPKVNERIRKRL